MMFEEGTSGSISVGVTAGGAGSAEVDESQADAVQDDGAPAECDAALEAALAENEVLRARLAELEAALAGVERRYELERALVDAGVIDVETALTVLGTGADSAGEVGDVSAVVSGLASSKPFLFRSGAGGRGAGSAVSGAAGGEASSLTGLADEARRSGDRRALTRYLRKRRHG
ncbi:MAG: hypothetical protein AAFR96_11890 [Planctomycetota bacterium]